MIARNSDGKRYNVVLRDTDANESLPTISIMNTLDGPAEGAGDRQKSLPI